MTQLPPESPIPEWLDEGLDWWDRFSKTQELMEDVQTCAAAGLSSDTCAEAVWAGACTMFLELGIEAATGNELAGVAGAAEAGTFFAFPTAGVQAWSSTGWFGAGRVTSNLGTGGFAVTAETALATAVCVR